MSTITVTVGMNSNRTLAPLPRGKARRLVAEVRRLLSQAGCTVHVDGATSQGEWRDVTTDEIVHELSRTWVAEAPDPDLVQAALSNLCERYEQDAIALTVGETRLVGLEVQHV